MMQLVCVLSSFTALAFLAETGTGGNAPASEGARPVPLVQKTPTVDTNSRPVITDPSGAARTNAPSSSLGTNTPTPLNIQK